MTKCIIIYPQTLHTIFLYNVVTEILKGIYTHIYIVVPMEHEPMYSSFYDRTESIVELKVVSTLDLEHVRNLITELTYFESENFDICGYEKFDELRRIVDPHYNLHLSLYYNKLFSRDDIISAYYNDFKSVDTTVIQKARHLVDINGIEKGEVLVTKVTNIISLPFALISDNKYRQFVNHKNITSINLLQVFRGVKNLFHFVKFISYTEFIVVSNDEMASMIYFLQTHKTLNNKYLISPNIKVYFDLDETVVDDYPYFSRPKLPSWTFKSFDGPQNGTNIKPNNFDTYSDDRSTLLLINLEDIHDWVLDDTGKVIIPDGVMDRYYQCDNHETPTCAIKNIDGKTWIDIVYGGLSYDLPSYDLVLGKNNYNISVYAIIQIKEIGDRRDVPYILFSYGTPFEDFTIYLFPKDDDVSRIYLGVCISPHTEEANMTNRVLINTNTSYLLGVDMIEGDDNKTVTHISLYNAVNGTIVTDNLYIYDFDQSTLPRRGTVQIAKNCDTLISYLEVIQGVITDGRARMESILNMWNDDTNINIEDNRIVINAEFEMTVANYVTHSFIANTMKFGQIVIPLFANMKNSIYARSVHITFAFRLNPLFRSKTSLTIKDFNVVSSNSSSINVYNIQNVNGLEYFTVSLLNFPIDRFEAVKVMFNIDEILPYNFNDDHDRYGTMETMFDFHIVDILNRGPKTWISLEIFDNWLYTPYYDEDLDWGIPGTSIYTNDEPGSQGYFIAHVPTTSAPLNTTVGIDLYIASQYTIATYAWIALFDPEKLEYIRYDNISGESSTSGRNNGTGVIMVVQFTPQSSEMTGLFKVGTLIFNIIDSVDGQANVYLYSQGIQNIPNYVLKNTRDNVKMVNGFAINYHKVHVETHNTSLLSFSFPESIQVHAYKDVSFYLDSDGHTIDTVHLSIDYNNKEGIQFLPINRPEFIFNVVYTEEVGNEFTVLTCEFIRKIPVSLVDNTYKSSNLHIGKLQCIAKQEDEYMPLASRNIFHNFNERIQDINGDYLSNDGYTFDREHEQNQIVFTGLPIIIVIPPKPLILLMFLNAHNDRYINGDTRYEGDIINETDNSVVQQGSILTTRVTNINFLLMVNSFHIGTFTHNFTICAWLCTSNSFYGTGSLIGLCTFRDPDRMRSSSIFAYTYTDLGTSLSYIKKDLATNVETLNLLNIEMQDSQYTFVTVHRREHLLIVRKFTPTGLLEDTITDISYDKFEISFEGNNIQKPSQVWVYENILPLDDMRDIYDETKHLYI